MTISAMATTALAMGLLLFGYWLRDSVKVLDRLNFPAPVIAGLFAALALLAARYAGLPQVKFDTVIQSPLMIGFFTSIGFSASFGLLRKGGPLVIVLFAFASIVAVAQGLLGAGIASAFGLNPLVGVLAGTATLSGGPATGLAFAPQFEAAGVSGAAAIATATGMSGILLASIFGGPLATRLIERRGLDPRGTAVGVVNGAATANEAIDAAPTPSNPTFAVVRILACFAFSMWLGGIISAAITQAGITLPPYIGAMLVASALRNIDDVTGVVRLDHKGIEVAGGVALSLFLVMAMMTLDLSLLAGLALPLLANLAAQMVMMTFLVLGPVWWLMGRDYDAAVAAGGFAGFMLGTTANAMAIMRALVEKYAIAPRAFLSVPLVGAFFIDFANAIIITSFINFWR